MRQARTIGSRSSKQASVARITSIARKMIMNGNTAFQAPNDSDEDDLEKPNGGQTEPAKRAIVPVEHHVAVFPKTLQRAIRPPRPLSRKCADSFRCFCPRYCAGHIHNALPLSMQREGEIRVFSEGLQTQPTCFIDRVFANSANRARHHGDAVPAVVGAPVQIKTAGVFQCLATSDERAQISNLCVA